jgi:hypothetical protein
MKKCPQCRKFNDDSNQCCIYCGKAFSQVVADYWNNQQYPPDAWYCLSCGSVGYPVKVWQGTFLMELLLFLASILVIFVIPVIGVFGIFIFLGYGIWRIASRKSGCFLCKQSNLIPVSSPTAIKILRQ